MFKVIAVLDAAQLEAVMRLPELRGVLVQVEHDAGETSDSHQAAETVPVQWDEPTGELLVAEDPKPKPEPRTIEPGGIERATFGAEGISGPDFIEFQRRMGALMKSDAFHRAVFPRFPALDAFEGPMVRARRVVMALCVTGNRFDPNVFNMLFDNYVEGKGDSITYPTPAGMVTVTFNDPEKPQ